MLLNIARDPRYDPAITHAAFHLEDPPGQGVVFCGPAKNLEFASISKGACPVLLRFDFLKTADCKSHVEHYVTTLVGRGLSKHTELQRGIEWSVA